MRAQFAEAVCQDRRLGRLQRTAEQTEGGGVEAGDVVAAGLQGVLRKDARSFDVLRVVEHHQGL